MTQPAPPSSPPDAVLAATVVIFRHNPAGGAPQLMMLERAENMRFAGGAAVFPGGRIDPADHELAQAVAPGLAPTDAAARIAAIRETLEETGLVIGVNAAVTAPQARLARQLAADHGALAPVLAHFGWTLTLERLVPFAHWCPPFKRAFDTHFFLADLGSGAVEVAEDGTENTRVFWSTAAEALALADQGAISLLFPTQCNLHRLEQYGSFGEARAHALAIPPRRIIPRTVTVDGIDYLTIPDDLGYPITRLLHDGIRRG